MGTSSINWRLANPFGIWMRDDFDPAHFFDLATKDRDPNKDESPADPWNSGHATDILEIDTGHLVVATQTSGIWSVGENRAALCLSNSWPHCRFTSLALGMHDPQREIYAGGEALYVTNLASPFPLFNWLQITSWNMGNIRRVLVLTDRIVLACDTGIFWSPIPTPSTGSYTWTQAVVHDEKGEVVTNVYFTDVAASIQNVTQTPRGMLVSEEIVAGGPGLFWGHWDDKGVLMIEPVIISLLDQSQPTLSTVSVASCASKRQRAYAVCARPLADGSDSPHLFAVVRSNDGGRSWVECGTSIEMDTVLSLAELAGHQGDYNNCVAVARWDPDIVAFGFNSTFLSFNGGESWHPQGIDGEEQYTPPRHLHEDIHGLTFSDKFPGANQNLYVASDGGVASITWGSSPWMIESDHQSDGQHGDFEALVLEGNELAHYTRSSDDLGAGFARRNVVTSRATGGGCLVVSDLARGGRRDYEGVVLEGSDLVHYWADNSAGPPMWNRAQVISTVATGPGCIIKSDYVTGGLGNLEVIVPEGSNLIHYWHEGSDRGAPWHRTATPITTHAASAACFIQGDFGSSGHGNFELVVLEDNLGPQGAGLSHYWRDSQPPYPWQGPTMIDRNASSQGCIFQTDYRSGDHGDFTVVVQAGRELVEWRRDNSGFPYPWYFVRKILGPGPENKATGPACAFQGSYKFNSEHGNFEMAACVDGKVVERVLFASSPPEVGWGFGPTISNGARTYKSVWNRQLPTLQLNSPKERSALHYGSLGVSSLIPGMVGSGSQDNGVIYCGADHNRTDQLITPWFRLDGGDGNLAAFLPYRTGVGDLPAVGRVFIESNNETEDDAGKERVGVKSSHQDGIRLVFYPGDRVIRFRTVNPGASPPPNSKTGLTPPLVEVVTEPRFPGVPEWRGRGLMCAIGTLGSDIYGLFVEDAANEGQMTPPLWWEYLGTAVNPAGEKLNVEAVGSRDGFAIVVGTAPITNGGGPTIKVENPEIYRLDSATGNLSLMNMDPALATPTFPHKFPAAFAVAVISTFEAYATTADDQVIRWDGSIWRATATLPPGAGNLRAITADLISRTPIVFVASTSRVFVSANRGASWLDASAGLPAAVQCSDIRFVHDADGSRLYLSAYGRSVWVAEQTVIAS